MPQGCNRETALTNGNCNSGIGEIGVRHSSRRSRCRASGRRATANRRAQESWAAMSESNNKLLNETMKHEEIVNMVERHTVGRARHSVTEEEVERWIDEEDFERDNSADMMKAATEMQRVESMSVPVHGFLPAEERGDGVFRGLMVQLNGIKTNKVRNRKAAQLQWLVRKYDVQIVGLGEIGVNWSKCRHKKRLLTLLPEIERSARSSTSHNSRQQERHGIKQQGGVGMIVLNDLLPYYKKGNKDFRHLGRWDSAILRGSQHHQTRVVQVYGVRPERSEQYGSVYQQHVRYMQETGIDGVSPRQLFETDLLYQLRKWREAGDRLILMMDANEHVLTGRLCRQLPMDGINLREITKDVVGSLCGYTHESGSQPIDGVWATPDITITGVKWLPFEQSPGDHRACLFEFTSLSAIGAHEKRIVYPVCRRLTSKNERSVEVYTDEMLKQFDIHRIEARLDNLTATQEASTTYPPDLSHPADILDRQVVEIQRHCEKICRKIYQGDTPCSPEYSLWYKRARMFNRLIRLKKGLIKNPGVLCKHARRLGIETPRRWTLDQLRHGRAIAKAWKRKLQPEAPTLRREHLGNRLVKAEADRDIDKAKAIRSIIDREASSAMWSEIKWTFADNGGRSNAVTRVERMEEGKVREYTEQSDIERVVREETQERFTAACSSQFCQGTLGEELGYVSNSETALKILAGQYEPPPETSDSTRLLIDEMGRIGQLVTRDAVRLDCTKEEFQFYWKKVSENTSSSMSGVHFGHYVTAAKSDRLSEFFARKITYIATTGRAPSRWGIGLNVLLEKVAGVALVNKLRAILLMEADMNMCNKLIFGRRMMDAARDHQLIPDEQFAEKQSDGQDGVFLKRLLADISRQLKIALAIISADAANCYDRVGHAFVSLVFQAFGVCLTAISAMLCTIQHMKFFLRTGFGESPGFMTALLGTIIQGVCQGNTAAPAAWSVVSAILIACYKQKNHGAIVTSPISKKRFKSAGVLFVDDVDLTAMKDGVEGSELMTEAQSCTTDWSLFLNNSGGTLKAEKCFGYLADYEWLDDGSWQYKTAPDSGLFITLPDHRREEISLLEVDEAQVTLGVATRPNGDDIHHLQAPGKPRDKWKSIRTRAETWVNRLTNGHLPSKFAWVSYRLQLWAGIRYGLGVLSIPLASFGELTTNFAYRVLPNFGINRHIKTGWRYLHSAFSGCGLLELSTESTISRLNMFLQHWDNPAPLGQALRASMECLQLEVGCSGFPLNESFAYMGPYTTHSWVRSFWECMDSENIQLDVDYPEIQKPRENDLTITDVAKMMGVVGDELEGISRCRLFTNSIFLSDVANAAGTAVDPTRSGRDRNYTNISAYRFPTTKPSKRDWDFWSAFWKKYCLPDGSLPRSLGKWVAPSHKRWEWFHDPITDCLYYDDGKGVDVYHQTGDTTQIRTRRQHCYARTGQRADMPEVTLFPVSVQYLLDGSVARLASGLPLHSEVKKEVTFLEFLEQWGGSWMWEDLYVPGGWEAVVESIADGSAIFVTDGSYNRSVRSDLSSSGWLLYCARRQKILLTCSFYEVTKKAGSYRGELMGLASIHVFIAAIEEYYSIAISEDSTIACDNLGALQRSQERRKKVPTSAKHSDIRRVLRTAHSRLRSRPQYEHVYGHQDSRKHWDQLSVLEKLNCHCDNLAKAALLRGITDDAVATIDRQKLPLESVAVFLGNQKITGECGDEIRFVIGLKKARRFYLEELGWMAATFDSVDWVSRDKALAQTTDMFRTWLCKQCSSFCATGRNMGRWFDSDATECPNCHQESEDSKHLLHCQDEGRTKFFYDEVKTLEGWLAGIHTDPALGAALTQYIKGRGQVTLREIVGPTTDRALLRLAVQQDVIGWDHMMEGKIAKLVASYQRTYLLTSASSLTAEDWMKKFITHLLHVTHGQWIYRNVSRHHAKHGLLQDLERQSLLREIDKYLSTAPEDVPEESRFLLEIDFQQIRTAATEKQSYWVHAMRAAIIAGRRVKKRRRGGGGSAAAVQSSTVPGTLSTFSPFPRFVTSTEPSSSLGGGLAAAALRLTGGSGSLDDQSNKRRRPD